MNRNDAKLFVNQQEPTFLQLAKKKDVHGGATYICPKCGNGSGKDGTGIVRNAKRDDKKVFKCFRCEVSEDVVGLWKLHTGQTSNKEVFDTLYAYYGLTIDESDSSIADSNHHEKPKATPRPEQEDFTEYFEKCAGRIGQTDYLAKRGISEQVAQKMRLGFDPDFKPWPALIIPTGRGSYVARNVSSAADKGQRYRKKGSSCIYNAKALKELHKPIVVVEGELDAISVMCAGGVAIGLGSLANIRQLLELLQQEKPVQPLVLALDNDEAGQEAEAKLAASLDGLNVAYHRRKLYGGCKDANEALLTARNEFTASVSALEQIGDETHESLREEYLKSAAVNYVSSFLNGIAESANTPCISTGFNSLDAALDGGLYEGLYIVGAISSLGKTTLVTQIADQIAEAGNDVMIFSLEMARTELMAKSISRLTLWDVLENGGDRRNAKTVRGILMGSRYHNYSQTEKDLIHRAVLRYGGYANRIFIHEGVGDIGAAQIRQKVNRHITLTGRKPVVIVDYLQILAPADVRASDKQNTDRAVLELKRMARDCKIPVIGISSLNRDNYDSEVSMKAYKESGSIEYSSDVLLGLQFQGAGQSGFNVNEAKRKEKRQVEVLVLKNRNGKTGNRVYMDYLPMFNNFVDVGWDGENGK